MRPHVLTSSGGVGVVGSDGIMRSLDNNFNGFPSHDYDYDPA